LSSFVLKERRSLRYCVVCSIKFIDTAIILVGPILAGIATLLILYVTFVYFYEIYPVIVSNRGTSESNLLTLLGFWLLCNLLFNYGMTMFVGPGHPPSKLDQETVSLLSDDPECREGQSHRFCRICNAIKPMRAHHCSICKICVLKMDHHCPWVNNCVGWRNHKHFLLFLFYMWTGSGFYLLVAYQNTLDALTGRPSTTLFLLSVVMCFSAFLATTLFLVWNIYLLISNQSTIEFYGNVFNSPKRRNPFDLGIRRNILEVFGLDRSLWSVLLPSLRKPAGDGIIFEMHDKDVLIRAVSV